MNRRIAKKPYNHHGLTLIELLLAVSIFTVTGGILYSILFQGLSYYRRVNQLEEPATDDRIIITKLTRDIRSAFIHSWVKFYGRSDEIYFCSMRRLDDSETAFPRLVKARYFFTLEKTQNGPAGLYLSEIPVEFADKDEDIDAYLLTRQFDEFTFEYGYWNPLEKNLLFKPEWLDSDKIPKIIRVTFRWGRNKKVHQMTLPLGELPEYVESEEDVSNAASQMTEGGPFE